VKLVSSLVIVAAAVIAAAVHAQAAAAHSDPCHQRHQCPSDHHTYAWGPNELYCTSYFDERLATDRTRVVLGGRLYWCRGAGVAPRTPATPSAGAVSRIDHVVDGDTVDLVDGRRVRLVQIDTPEVYNGLECYGSEASAATKRLLPPGTAVRLAVEPSTDLVDSYGRLLRYVIRAADNVNVNFRLVADGAATPYFYAGRRGRYAAGLERLSRRARAAKLGLWGRCPGTPYDPYHAAETGPR
jgi:micrococcal nuclease